MAAPTASSSSGTSAATATATPLPLNADTTLGTTTINDSVVSKVAGIAAREVPGVHDLGGGAARAIGAIRERLNNNDYSRGVSVEVGETQVAVDLTIVVDYPTPMMDVATAVRAAVTEAVTSLVGLEVTEVNIAINDVNIPALGGVDDGEPETRVR